MRRLAEDEAKRVEELTDAELRAEIAGEGHPAWKPSSTEALLEKVKARAAAQGRLSVRPSAAVAVDELADMTARPVRAPRRASRSIALLAAAIAVAALAVAVEGPAIVAHFRGPSIEPDKAHPLTPVEVARGLRQEAIAKCDQGEWKACGEELDEAKRIDPNGDGEARVVKARGEIEEAVGGGVKVQGPREQKPARREDWK